ncbi:MAG: hypothetical protein WAN12_06500 [Candidatus Acidiferrum sp.]
MAKTAKQIQQLFLRLLNFTPELLAKTQEEAKLQHTSVDALIRDAVEKHLRHLRVAREEEKKAEMREYATLVLKAHFEEDRNEFLTESAIRQIGSNKQH